MRILFLISDDYVWAPKVLRSYLQQNASGQVVGVVGVPGTSNHRSFFSFVFIYLTLLSPWLFIRRTWQSVMNRLSAAHGNALTSLQKVSDFYKIPYRRFPDINAPATRDWILAQVPDILISIQPQYIKKELQKIAPFVINIHPAKLPAYRGPAPIFWVLNNEEKETAVSAHFVNERFDGGEIVFQKVIPISDNESYFSLGEKITEIMPEVLAEAVKVLERGGPYQPNRTFPGCYQSYPPFLVTLKYHTRQWVKRLKRYWGAKQNIDSVSDANNPQKL